MDSRQILKLDVNGTNWSKLEIVFNYRVGVVNSPLRGKVNCLPFLGQKTKVRGMGGLSMTTYGPGVRSAAADMFERGLGRRLGVSRAP